MANFSHLKKHFEELEASMPPEERAERDRRCQETLAELVKRQKRMLAPYRQMEQMLAPCRGMGAALAPLRLAEEIRRLAKPFPAEPELARLDALERSLAQLTEPSPIEAALAELRRIDELEGTLGLSTRELLAERAGRTMFAELEAMLLQEHALRDALNPRSLIEESLLRLTEPSPLESMVETLLRSEERQRELLSSFPADLWTDDGLEPETVDDAPAETPLEETPARVPSRPSLIERRMASYHVLRNDIRRESEDSPILDELIWRMHVLLVAMERDVEDGRY